MTLPKLCLRPEREASVLRRHPWIFEGAVGRVDGHPAPGATVMVADASGKPLGRAAFSPVSQIRARMWSFDPGEEIDTAFFRRKIETALGLRGGLRARTRAWRWINSENDGLPGLIVDVYAQFAVAQFLSAGVERWKSEIAAVLKSFEGVEGVFEKSEADSRKKEGLEPSTGGLLGDEPPGRILIEEQDIRFNVDVRGGHKTGFYLDQRESRRVIGGLSPGAEALNAFCYTGGFTAAMLKGGARHVVNIDSSAPAMELGRENLALNELDPARAEWIEADVFQHLRQCRDSRRTFDLIVLDPPKFAASKAALERAARAYKDINLLALKLLRPGGRLATFSCSGLVSADLFQKILFGAALDARRDVQIIQRLAQPEDHPVLLSFPEGEYLKGLVLRCAD